MSRLEFALNAVRFARGYTNGLLDAVPEENWRRMPEPGVTHVAWQVGHLAWAQYRLIFGRVLAGRCEAPALIPAEYSELFGKGSRPNSDASQYPGNAEIRSVFDSVHGAVLKHAATIPDSVLDEPSAPPHPAFTDKFGALLWSARHELVHAGQIALLRRLFGLPPLR